MIWLEMSMMAAASSSSSEDHGSTEYPEALVELLKSLVAEVPNLKGPLLEIMDVSLLHKAGIIASEAELQKKIRLTNTQQHYRQHKFNLMVEESEGFAKLLHAILLLLNHKVVSSSSEDGGPPSGNGCPSN